MNQFSLQCDDHPFPFAGYLLLGAVGIADPYIYRFTGDRWYLRSDGVEYMVIQQADGGLKLVENPF